MLFFPAFDLPVLFQCFWLLFSGTFFPITFLKHRMTYDDQAPRKRRNQHSYTIQIWYVYIIIYIYTPKKGWRLSRRLAARFNAIVVPFGSIGSWSLISKSLCTSVKASAATYPKSSVVSVTKVQIMLGSPFFVGKCHRILVVCCEFHLPTPGSQPEVYWKNGTFRLESKDNKDSNSMCKAKVRIGEGQEAGCHMCFTDIGVVTKKLP